MIWSSKFEQIVGPIDTSVSDGFSVHEWSVFSGKIIDVTQNRLGY